MEEDIKGKAIGGHARADSLTPERRKEIAQNAAIARWSSPTTPDGIPVAKYEGVLEISPWGNA